MRTVLYIMGQLNDDDIAWIARTGQQRTYRGDEVLIALVDPWKPTD